MKSSQMGLLKFRLSSPILRWICTVLLFAVIAPGVYRGYGVYRADRIARTDKTVEGYTRAIEFEPSNATLWWHRGRLRHYSLNAADISRAASDYKRALSINPRLGDAWADLADCLDQMGRYAEAEAALERAFSVRRYSPLIRWQAGNFYLRRGNLPKMYECFKTACFYDDQKLGIAMDISWKLDSDHREILPKLIPDTLSANLRYLNFLVARNELDLAAPVWQRFLKNSTSTDSELKPSASFEYIDQLLTHSRILEALDVWNDILRKTRSGLADARLMITYPGRTDSSSGNLIWNGSFENEILRGGFDWRYENSPTIEYRSNAANRMDGLKSLQVTFGGENIAYDFLYQIVPVLRPGAHQLDFYLRTQNMTTDQTPYLVIREYPEAAGSSSARSNFFPSTTDWTRVSVPFTARAGCKAVRISLRRDRSEKFDDKIKGTLWLDRFMLRNIED